MQQAQRVAYNPALDYAISKAVETALPLQVYFFLSNAIPDATAQHYRFMLEGLAETGRELQKLNIPLHIAVADDGKIPEAPFKDAACLVMDHGYLDWQKRWRDEVYATCEQSGCSIVEIDTEATVPVHLASPKEEYSAATLRRKILPLLNDFLLADPVKMEVRKTQLPSVKLATEHSGSFEDSKNLWDWAAIELKLPAETGPGYAIQGSHSEALYELDSFIRAKLKDYATMRNHPNLDIQSNMSAYLHFGQISPIEIMHRVLEHTGTPPQAIPNMIADKNRLTGMAQSIGAYAEELIIRRELAMNFCHYNPAYENSNSLPQWARQSLNDHLGDPRETDYSLDRLELGETEDIYWNAAQKQLLHSGKMHNYMRMYWGKRLLAWCPGVDEAYQILAYLNNKYELDGRDANGWAGIAWCFGKHDRPWATRPIYGMVRFMNAGGLNRKFDMEAYLKQWSKE
jgi:deoxyribodipyrimidine photo-lyase